MPLGQGITGITGVLGAIPRRIEVAGHGPTWRITGESFESVVGYAQERFDDFAPLDVARRDRWWPRITLTVTTDPDQAVGAPTLEQLHGRLAAADVPAPAEQPDRTPAAVAHRATELSEDGRDRGPADRTSPATAEPAGNAEADEPADASPLSTLAAIFADQSREAPAARLPRQRRGASRRG